MTASFSVYLDALRFTAALAVFLEHVGSRLFTLETIWWRLALYGDVAVATFFVLSGYVIAHVTTTQERSARDYFSSRWTRLLSVAVPGLLLTFLFDSLGLWLNPDFYRYLKVLWKPVSWEGYASALFFVNEYQVFGFNGISPGTNGPYWSLSFEATYYLLGGLFLFFRRMVWLPISMLVLALAGQTIAAMLPLWALGFALYTVPQKVWRFPLVLWAVALISGLAILGTPMVKGHFQSHNLGIFLPYGRGDFTRNVLADYWVAITLSLHLLAMRGLLNRDVNLPARCASTIRWLGSLTFPLYCFHFPAICLLQAVSPWGEETYTHLAYLLICTSALVIALTPLCDALKWLIRGALTKNKNRPIARVNAQ